ncbi:hypothetical protein BOTBODRAFT_28428 [Botryobasidium botryosum FD-172 SS1]|uniref:Major facilitator superfamily (MFS) profile domain-containing protein n=1 Tax=Botryobasidium botryosum (strain FD-172 SS1) TaxID=930990 RepID=A0A067MW74_BOTB1|nr:hypothetical protein BOTBODRAFT_28428 [Botryobasidium botryosum FD-172 SS1]
MPELVPPSQLPLLEDTVGPNLLNPNTLSSEQPEEQHIPACKRWYQTPSPWWLVGSAGFAVMLMGAAIAPEAELLVGLACAEIRPEYSADMGAGNGSIFLRPGYSPPSAECKADPMVLGAVAALSTAMQTISGVLSCLTTGWWGGLSDRFGRTRVMALTSLGSLLSILTYIAVTHAYDVLPGGYRFLIFSSISQGFFGGMAARSAAAHAYISDCSAEDSRSGWFSMLFGLAFGGMAFGPLLGSALIHATGSIFSIFYLVLVGELIYIAYIAFIVPESLGEEARKHISDRLDKAREERRAKRVQPSMTLTYAWQTASRALGFLAPMAIFFPRQRPAAERGGRGRDWNITFVAIAFGFFSLLMGAYPFKFQYAIGNFGWGSVQLGIWLSFIGIGRAVALCIVVPLVARLIKRATSGPIALPVSSEEPLQHDAESNTAAVGRSHPAHYDLIMARISVAIEFFCYVLLLLSTGPKSWIVGTQLSSFSSGFAPMLQSVALSLVRGETNNAGALFGGMSVLQALCSGIIGPFVFGTVYMFTVGSFPKAIFIVGLGITAVTFGLVCALRLPLNREPVSQPLAGEPQDGTSA